MGESLASKGWAIPDCNKHICPQCEKEFIWPCEYYKTYCSVGCEIASSENLNKADEKENKDG